MIGVVCLSMGDVFQYVFTLTWSSFGVCLRRASVSAFCLFVLSVLISAYGIASVTLSVRLSASGESVRRCRFVEKVENEGLRKDYDKIASRSGPEMLGFGQGPTLTLIGPEYAFLA